MKGSLNAFEFADIIAKAFTDCSKQFKLRKIPVADGGDFTGEVLKRALNAEQVKLKVKGPFGEETDSVYARAGNTAIIEMADASGIKLVKPEQLNPLKATSFGTGQLIADSINNGCNAIFLGIGGSATVDGGSGLLEALGFRLLDEDGKECRGNGGNLAMIRKIEKPDFPVKIQLKIISDVNNPLLGGNGAAVIFGPQKGADEKMVENLENGLNNWGKLLEKQSGKKLIERAGAGAAGGIAVPLVAFFDAEIVPGARFVLEQLHFDEHVQWADIVITGEGKIDGQTLSTKAPMAVAHAARRFNKPVFAFGGSVFCDASEIFDGIFSMINQPLSLKDAMKNADELLYDFSFEFAKMVRSLKK